MSWQQKAKAKSPRSQQRGRLAGLGQECPRGCPDPGAFIGLFCLALGYMGMYTTMMVYRGVIQGYMGFYRDYIGDNGRENGDYSSILDYIGVILGYWRIN